MILFGTIFSRWKCLHAVCPINDVLRHTKFHSPPNGEFAPAVAGALAEAFSAAATPGRQGAKLKRVPDIWRTKEYFRASFVHQLALAMTSPTPQPSQPLASSSSPSSARPESKKPLLLPLFHGDPSPNSPPQTSSCT